MVVANHVMGLWNGGLVLRLIGVTGNAPFGSLRPVPEKVQIQNGALKLVL